MLWLNAKSLIALGITTATRKGPMASAWVGSAPGSGVSAGGAVVGVGLVQALTNNAISKISPNHLRFLFMFSFLEIHSVRLKYRRTG
jgi:hypothetical protein